MGQSIKGLTIEIGGDTTSLQSALGKCANTSKNLQTELNFVNKALKLDPKNVELVTQKKQLLKEAISNTKDKLDALKQAQAQADQLMQQGVEIDQEEYRKLQREIAFSENKLKSYIVELNTMGASLEQIGGKVSAFGNKLSDLGSALMPVTTAISAIGVASAGMASTFEDSMAKVSTIADTTEVPMEELESAILELSNQTGVSANDIAENVYNAISAGQKTGDAVNFVSNATSLARAGFAETGDALDILTTILNAYGLEAEKVSEVSDMLIQTQNLGKTTVGELSSAMGKVIPTAKAQGVELDQLCASYAVMTSNGIATAETTTYLNSMLNELGKQGTSASKAFAEGTEHIKEGGLTMAEAMEQGWSLTDVLSILDEQAYASGTTIANMFGSAEAGKAASVLWDNASKLNEVTEQMGESAGSTATAYEKLETTSYKVGVTINQLKNTLIDLGSVLLEMLAPVLDTVSQKVSQFTEWFKSLSDEQKKTIITVAGLVASLAPLLKITGKVVSSVGSIISVVGKCQTAFTTFSAGLTATGTSLGAVIAPIAGIVAVIALLVGAFATLWKTNEDFRNNILEIWESIKSKFEEFTSGIVDRLNALGFDFENITEVISAIWTQFCNLLAPVFEGVFQQIANILSFVFDVLTGILDVFIGIFTGNWDQAWLGIQEIFGAVWDFIVSTFQNYANVLTGLLDVVCGWFGTTWSETWQNISDFFVGIWNGIVSFFTNIGNSIVSTATSIWDSIVSFFTTGIPTFIANVIAWIQELPYNIGFMLGTLLGNIIQFGADVISWIATNVPLFINNVITFVSQLPGKIWEWLVATLNKIITWGVNMIAKAKEIGSQFIENVVNFVKTLPSKIWTWLQATITKLVTWKNNMIQKGREAISGLINAVIEGAKSIPEKMASIGKNIVDGVWKGICDAKDAFVSNVKDFFGGIVDGAKSALGINSPSKAFETEVGQWIPPGVSSGIYKTAGVVKDALTSVFTGAIDTVKGLVSNVTPEIGATIGINAIPDPSGNTSVTNVTNNNNVTINAEKVDEEHIDDICDEINRRLGMAY